jgi:hypothetical protein
MGLTFYDGSTRGVTGSANGQRGTDFRTGVQGNMWYKEFEFQTVANSTPAYAAGGISLADANVGNSKFGMARVDHCSIEAKGGFVFNYDIETDKILMWQSDEDADAVLVQEANGAPAAVPNIKGMAWGQI